MGCWRGSKDDESELHLREISLAQLSQTLQDAIEITRLLGFQYLWVDSMCMIQDDDNDWLQEPNAMGAIYENAYCTLAAADGIDGSFNLLPDTLKCWFGRALEIALRPE